MQPCILGSLSVRSADSRHRVLSRVKTKTWEHWKLLRSLAFLAPGALVWAAH